MARHATEALKDQEHALVTTGQNLVEAWNVITRPVDRNGLGQTPEEADRIVRHLEQAFPRLEDPPSTYDRWRELVVRFGVSGAQVHDARLVAVMLESSIMRILTFDAGDFRRYAELGIQVVHPTEV